MKRQSHQHPSWSYLHMLTCSLENPLSQLRIQDPIQGMILVLWQLSFHAGKMDLRPNKQPSSRKWGFPKPALSFVYHMKVLQHWGKIWWLGLDTCQPDKKIFTKPSLSPTEEEGRRPSNSVISATHACREGRRKTGSPDPRFPRESGSSMFLPIADSSLTGSGKIFKHYCFGSGKKHGDTFYTLHINNKK